MELKALTIKNFMGIGDGIVTFDKTGLTLIEGVNHDSPSSQSNGAGKSTIGEALYWVMFGKTRRGLTGDDVVNEIAKNNCFVALSFDDFMLCRTRKSIESGNTLTLHQLVGIEWKDISKGTIKETQALLESIIKMSELTFAKVAFFGQADIKAFADLTDAELKQVFEQALGLTCLTSFNDLAKAYTKGQQAELAKNKLLYEGYVRELNFTKERIEFLTGAVKDLEAKRAEERKRIEAQITSNQIEMDEINAKRDEFDKRYEAEMAACREAIEKHGKLKDLKKILDEKHDNLKIELSNIRARMILAKGHIDSKLAELKNIESKVGETCGECGKYVYDSTDVAPLADKVKEKLRELGREYEIQREAQTTQQIAIDGVVKLYGPLEDKMAAFEDTKARVARIESEKVFINEEARRAVAIYTRIGHLKKMIEDMYKEPAIETYAGELREATNKKMEIEADLEDSKESVDALELEIKTAEMLCDILGNGGLKSHIFDSVTPALNKTISDYMAILNPEIEVAISTVTKLKSGEFREKFATKVTNRHGSSSYCGSSGGERQMINLAIALAFNSVCRAMTEGSVNALFLDEPLENLDESSAEGAMELCNEFIAKVPNTFLISHNPAVKDLVANRIKVEKSGGMARIRA